MSTCCCTKLTLRWGRFTLIFKNIFSSVNFKNTYIGHFHLFYSNASVMELLWCKDVSNSPEENKYSFTVIISLNRKENTKSFCQTLCCKKICLKSFILNRPVGPDVAVVTLLQEVIHRPFTKVISKCTYWGILKSLFG